MPTIPGKHEPTPEAGEERFNILRRDVLHAMKAAASSGSFVLSGYNSKANPPTAAFSLEHNFETGGVFWVMPDPSGRWNARRRSCDETETEKMRIAAVFATVLLGGTFTAGEGQEPLDFTGEIPEAKNVT